MSACTCTLRADECTGSSGIYYPLQDGGQCAIQDCEKQVTTDNTQTLVNALAEIERLTKVAYDLVQNNTKERIRIERKDAALQVALDALELAHPRFGVATEKYKQAITTIKEALT